MLCEITKKAGVMFLLWRVSIHTGNYGHDRELF